MKTIKVAAVIAIIMTCFLSANSSAQSADALKRANELIQQRKFDQAIGLLNPVVAKFKDYYEAWYLLGRANYGAGILDKAEDCLKKSAELKKDFVAVWMLLGNIYEKQGKKDKALGAVEKAVELEPQNSLIRTRHAELLEGMNRHEDAVKEYISSYKIDSSLFDSVLKAAQIYINFNNYQSALNLLNKIATEMPVTSEYKEPLEKARAECSYNLLVMEGEKLFNSGNISKAQSKYLDALKIMPQKYDCAVKLAGCYQLLKNNAKAMDVLQSVTSNDPANGPAWHMMAVIKSEQGKNSEASEYALKAIQTDPGNAQNYILAGRIFEQLQDFDKAKRYYSQALVQNDGLGDAHLRLGFLMANERQYDEAITHLESASKILNNAQSRDLLNRVKSESFIAEGNAAFDRKDYKAASDNYEKSLRFFQNPTAAINKANALIELGDTSGAVAILKKYTQGKDTSLNAMESLAQAYKKNGNIVDAEKMLTSMRDMRKNDWNSWYQSASFYFQNAKYDQAEDSSLKALELVHKDDERAKVKILLARVKYEKGSAFFNDGKYDAAEKCFNSSLSNDSTLDLAKSGLQRIATLHDTMKVMEFMKKGNDAYQNGDYAAAADAYRKILEIRDDLTAKFNLANCCFLLKNYDQAQIYLKDYLSLKTNDQEGITLLAQSYIESGNKPAARNLLSSEIKKGNDSDRLEFCLGLLNESEERIKDAIICYEKSLKLNPQNLQALINLGNLYYAGAEYTKSQQQYEKILAIEPDNSVARYNLGMIYYKKNLMQQALSEFKNAENYIKDYPPLFFNLARTYFYTGNYEEALRYGQKAGATKQRNTIPYKWGMANIMAKLFENEKDVVKKEDFRRQAIGFCEACITNHENWEISILARERIVDIQPDRKYLYQGRYEVDRKFTPLCVENVIYSWSDQEKAVIKAYKETGETLWKFKMNNPPTGQYRIGKDLFVPSGNDIIVIDPIKGQEKYRISGIVVSDLIPLKDGVIIIPTPGNSAAYYKSSRKEWGSELQDGHISISGTNILHYNTSRLLCLGLGGAKLWSMPLTNNEQVRNICSFKDYVAVETVLSGHNHLKLVETSSGKIAQNIILVDSMQSPPLMTYDRIICPLKDNLIVSLDRSGKTVWQKKSPSQIVSIDVQNDTLVFSTKESKIYGWAPEDGKTVWEYAVAKDNLDEKKLYTIYYRE